MAGRGTRSWTGQVLPRGRYPGVRRAGACMAAGWLRAHPAPGAAETSAVSRAAAALIPGCTGIRLTGKHLPRIVADLNGTEVPAGSLSGGQDALLALAIGLALQAPAGIALVDEIELHLHPAAQRDLIAAIPRAFPGLQVIATTLSPCILGEARPGTVRLLDGGRAYDAPASYGADASRVLEELMGAPARCSEVRGLLDAVSGRIEARNLPGARDLVRRLAAILGENDPDVIHCTALLGLLQDED